MTEVRKSAEEHVEQIVSRLKIRRIAANAIQRGHLKKHLNSANEDIVFLLGYVSALARELTAQLQKSLPEGSPAKETPPETENRIVVPGSI